MTSIQRDFASASQAGPENKVVAKSLGVSLRVA